MLLTVDRIDIFGVHYGKCSWPFHLHSWLEIFPLMISIDDVEFFSGKWWEVSNEGYGLISQQILKS